MSPYEQSHACSIDPTLKVLGSQKRTHNGKSYAVRIGRKPGRTKGSSERSYLYSADVWTEAQARVHCKDHGGRFEPAMGKRD